MCIQTLNPELSIKKLSLSGLEAHLSKGKRNSAKELVPLVCVALMLSAVKMIVSVADSDDTVLENQPIIYSI